MGFTVRFHRNLWEQILQSADAGPRTFDLYKSSGVHVMVKRGMKNASPQRYTVDEIPLTWLGFRSSIVEHSPVLGLYPQSPHTRFKFTKLLLQLVLNHLHLLPRIGTLQFKPLLAQLGSKEALHRQ